MIIDINQEDKETLSKINEYLHRLRFGLLHDGAEILDYLDCFEYNFLPRVQNSLPTKVRKVYLARQMQLIDKLPQIKGNALENLDKRKIYLGIKCIDKNTREFMETAFSGYESIDTKPIDLLIDAEYHAIVSRIIYNATQCNQDEME